MAFTSRVVSRAASRKAAKAGRAGKAAKGARGARVAGRTAVIAAFSVTLVTPDGESVIECDGDTYILDAAEVRARAPVAPARGARGARAPRPWRSRRRRG